MVGWALWALEAQRRINWLGAPVGGGSERGSGDTRVRRQTHLQEGADPEAGAPRQVYGPGSGLLGFAEGLGTGLGALWRGRLPCCCARDWVCVCQEVYMSALFAHFERPRLAPTLQLIILHHSLRALDSIITGGPLPAPKNALPRIYLARVSRCFWSEGTGA